MREKNILSLRNFVAQKQARTIVLRSSCGSNTMTMTLAVFLQQVGLISRPGIVASERLRHRPTLEPTMTELI
jgi:hypothetical protein